MQKRKILYVITKANWGGAQRYVFDLAAALAEHPEYEPMVAFGVGDNMTLKERLMEAGIAVREIEHLTRDVRLAGEVRVFTSLVRLFSAERPDVVHLNSSKIGALGALAGRIARVPRIIYTAHGLPFFEDRPWWQRRVLGVITYVTFILCHRVILVSKREYEYVLRWPFVKNKIVHIYNGIPEIPFLPQADARVYLSEHFGARFPEGRIIIGGNAELTRNKGVPYLLEALAKLKKEGVSFSYVHFSDGELREQLMRQVQESELQEHVQFLGFVPEARLYLKAFDMFVLASVKEGLPYVLLEAGAAGLPIVATDVGGVSEIVADNTGVLVPPKNSIALTDALIQMLQNKDFRRSYSGSIKNYVRGCFSLLTMRGMTFDLYAQKS